MFWASAKLGRYASVTLDEALREKLSGLQKRALALSRAVFSS